MDTNIVKIYDSFTRTFRMVTKPVNDTECQELVNYLEAKHYRILIQVHQEPELAQHFALTDVLHNLYDYMTH